MRQFTFFGTESLKPSMYFTPTAYLNSYWPHFKSKMCTVAVIMNKYIDYYKEETEM